MIWHLLTHRYSFLGERKVDFDCQHCRRWLSKPIISLDRIREKRRVGVWSMGVEAWNAVFNDAKAAPPIPSANRTVTPREG